MLQFSRAKTWAILATVLLSLLLTLPNVLNADWQKWLSANTIARPMTLGLDLQGGSNILMEVDRVDFRKLQLNQLIGDIRAVLRKEKLAYEGLQRTETGATVRLKDQASADKAETEMRKLVQAVDPGLFSTGVPRSLYEMKRDGLSYAYSFTATGLDSKIGQAVEQAQKVIESRINALGTSETAIQRQGKDRIVIQLPGIKDPQAVIDLLGDTGRLTFQLLCDSQPTAENDRPPPDCAAYKLKDGERFLWVQTSALATVDGADLVDAQPTFDQQNRSVVSFRFNQKGALKFGKLTTDNVNKPFAIVLDDIVVSYPEINEPILGGAGQISGNFSVQEATNLAIVLRSGALPAKLVIVEQRTVGPSLGSDSIRAGVIASIVGLIGVIIFVIIAYGTFGIFANLALIANMLMLLALMSVFGFTLTLPGIAGIVLTMGMAIDSNVLVFERIREEWRNGRTALNAIEVGFKAALATVVDANVTTLIAAVTLFGIGSGPIRGFAVTLAIGVLTTMFTAFTLTRLIIAVWVRRAKPKEVPLG